MKDQIIKYVARSWGKFELKHRPKHIDFFVKNKYRKLSFFLLHHGRPFAIAKCTPFPKDWMEILEEYSILKQISSRLKGQLASSFPKPLSMRRINGVPVLFQSFLQGTPMSSQISSSSGQLEKDLNMVNKWLISLNKCLRKQSILLSDARLVKRIDKAIELDRSLSKRDFEWVYERIRLYGKKRVFWVPKHTDFWPGNILVEGHELRVVDWEDFGLSNMPLFDLFHFIVSYFEVMGRGFRSFFGQSKYKCCIINAVDEYCRALDVDTRLVQLFFLLYLVEFYNLRHSQEGADYEVTRRSNIFLKMFLKNRERCIFK